MSKERPTSPEEMMGILKKKYKRYRNYKGVYYIDIGYKYKGGKRSDEICLRFHVEAKLPETSLGENLIPGIIDGIKTDIIVSWPVNYHRIGQRYPELQGGIEIQNSNLPGSGTLGGIFLNENNQLVGLGNYHVLVGENGELNDEIIQPGVINITDNDIIGNLSRWNETYDCAIFVLNNKRIANLGTIAGFNGIISGYKKPVCGNLVKKSGIATDVTYGIIDGISNNGSFTIVNNPEKPNTGDKISDSGDSGSLWVLDQDTDSQIVGMLYQGNIINFDRAYAFDISIVMKQLNIKFNN